MNQKSISKLLSKRSRSVVTPIGTEITLRDSKVSGFIQLPIYVVSDSHQEIMSNMNV